MINRTNIVVCTQYTTLRVDQLRSTVCTNKYSIQPSWLHVNYCPRLGNADIVCCRWFTILLENPKSRKLRPTKSRALVFNCLHRKLSLLENKLFIFRQRKVGHSALRHGKGDTKWRRTTIWNTVILKHQAVTKLPCYSVGAFSLTGINWQMFILWK